MADDKPVTASHSQVQPGIGGDTSIRINVKHVLIILGTLITMGWGLAKYFYEQTHKDIDEVKDEVKELEKKIDEMDKRVDGHDVEISKLKTKEEAAQQIATVTGIDRSEVEGILGIGHGAGTGTGYGRGRHTTVRSVRRPDLDNFMPGFGGGGGGTDPRDPFVEAAGEEPPSEPQGFRERFLAACRADPELLDRYPRACMECSAVQTDDECYALLQYASHREDLEASAYVRPSPTMGYEGYEDYGFTEAMVTVSQNLSPGEKRRGLRRSRRAKRREARRCIRRPWTCEGVSIPDGSGLDFASTYLAKLQNAEADLRQKP